MGVEVASGKTTLFSPVGALTREELDLVDAPASSLVMDELLPESPVAVGGTWKHSQAAIMALLGLEAVSFAEVHSVFDEVKSGVARISAAGTVQGGVGGVATEIELKIKYNYDLKAQRITWLALLIKEKRAIGHVRPASTSSPSCSSKSPRSPNRPS